MKRSISTVCCLISFMITGCAPSKPIAPPLTPTPVATPTPTESPEEIMTNAVKTACEMSPATSADVGVSTDGSAVARLCPDVESGMTLPEEWTAKTPGGLHYVVAVQDGGIELHGQCGPYVYTVNGTPGPLGGIIYVNREAQSVEISLIDTQTGKVVNSQSVSGPWAPMCPQTITSTSNLNAGPPSADEVQAIIVEWLTQIAYFPTLFTLTGHTDTVWRIAFSPDGSLLASGSADQTVKLWDVTSGKEVRTLRGHTGSVNSVAFAPDGKVLASGSRDGTVKLWDVATGEEVRTLTGHKDGVSSVVFSPDGKLLASGAWDNTVRLWDVASGKQVNAFKDHTELVTSVAFSPDGRLLASASNDKTIGLRDLASGERLRPLTNSELLGSAPVYEILRLAFSPDGTLLASRSMSGKVTLWSPENWQVVRMLWAPNSDGSSLAFSPDGRLLAGGGPYGWVTFWDVSSGEALHVLRLHTAIVNPNVGLPEDVNAVAFSPDGKLFASGSNDKTVIVTALNLP